MITLFLLMFWIFNGEDYNMVVRNSDYHTINKIALRLVLLFYRMQKESIPVVRDFLINFRDVCFVGFEIEEYGNASPFYTAVTSCADTASGLYSAFEYLRDKNMLDFKSKKTLDGVVTLYGFRLTAKGIDVVEFSDGKKGGRKKLIENFNLNLNFKLDFESILKIDLFDFARLLP